MRPELRSHSSRLPCKQRVRNRTSVGDNGASQSLEQEKTLSVMRRVKEIGRWEKRSCVPPEL